MANSVPMTTREAIKALHKRGYSKRKIARELGIHRKTVGNYLEEAKPPDPLKVYHPDPRVRGAVGEPRGRYSEFKVCHPVPRLRRVEDWRRARTTERV